MTAREVGPGHTGDEASVQRAPTAARLASISDVAITVVHGSLDHATYALMVGSFAGVQLSPVERFVGRQFAGLLSSSDPGLRFRIRVAQGISRLAVRQR